MKNEIVYESDLEDEAEAEAEDYTNLSEEDLMGSKFEVSESVNSVISKIEQAQLLRTREEISSQLNDILQNVQRIIHHYTFDESIHVGKKMFFSEYKQRRLKVLEKIEDFASSTDIKENILLQLLAWLEEWHIILSDVTAADVDDYPHFIAQMELLPDSFKSFEGNVKRLSVIGASFFEDKKKQERIITARKTLWKSWKERVLKRPATAHALTPNQMINDEFATNSKVSEIYDMLQELIDTTMFNNLENNAINYIASTISNLSKAMTSLNNEVKVINLYPDMYISEAREQESAMQVIKGLCEENEMLQQKLRYAEEKCEQLIKFKASPTSTLKVSEISPQSPKRFSLTDEESIDNFLTKKYENTLGKAQGSEFNWDVAISHTPEVEMTADLIEQQSPLPEIPSLKEDWTDEYQSQEKRTSTGSYEFESSRSSLTTETSKQIVSDLELQAEQKTSQEVQRLSVDIESKSQRVLSNFPSTDRKSRRGKSGTNKWERLRKHKLAFAIAKNQVISGHKKLMKKESKSLMSFQAESSGITRLEKSAEKVKIKGKEHQVSSEITTSKKGKAEEKDVPLFIKKVKSQQHIKSQSKITKETSESTIAPGSPDGKSEQNNLDEFHKAIMSFLKEKIHNTRTPLDKKTVPEGELLLKTAEVEKIGIIKSKMEEYFQSVAGAVAKILRKYKDIKKVQTRENQMKQKVSFIPRLDLQRAISAKSEISFLLSSESMDPVIQNLTHEILTEIEKEGDAPVVAIAGKVHKEEKEKESQDKYLQVQGGSLDVTLKQQLQEERDFWKMKYEEISKDLEEKIALLQMKEKQKQQKQTRWQKEVLKLLQQECMQKQTEQYEEQKEMGEEEQQKQQHMEAWMQKMKEQEVSFEEKGQQMEQIQKEVKQMELEISWEEEEEKEKPERKGEDDGGQWPTKTKEQMKIKEEIPEKLEHVLSLASMTLTPRWKNTWKEAFQLQKQKEFHMNLGDEKYFEPAITPTSAQFSSRGPLSIPGQYPTKSLAVILEEAQAQDFTLSPEQAQAQGITLSPEQAQAQAQRITLSPEQAQELGITVTPQEAQAQGITLTPQQAQAQGITLTPQQAEAQGITPTPQEAQAQRITVTPQEAQAQRITVTPQEAQAQRITVTPQEAQAQRITVTPQQAQAQRITVTPQEAQAQRITLTPQEAQAQRITVTPQQAQAQRITVTPQEAQAQRITVTSQEAQAQGITLTPQQAQAQRITVTPQQAQAQRITVTPQEAQAQRITVTLQEAQALGITVTPQQAQAQRITVTPQQAQALGITVTPQQAQAQRITVTPQEAQAQGITLTPQQAQALGITFTPQEAQALGITVTPQEAQAQRITVTLQEAQELGITVTPQQAQAQRITVTPQEAQAQGITVTPKKARKRGITLTPQQAQALGITLNPQKSWEQGVTVTPQEAQALGIIFTRQQARELGITVTHQHARSHGISLTHQQAQALGITFTGPKAGAKRITVTPQQAQELGIILTPRQARAQGITVTLEQAQALGITLTPEQAQAQGLTVREQGITATLQQAQGITVTPRQARALGITLTPEQAQAQGIILTPQQAQALGITLTLQQAQAQAQGITVTPRQARALGITLTPEQAQAQGITLTPQQTQALGITLTPQQAQGITVTPRQARALGITLTPEQAQAQGITLTPQQTQALGITLIPQQAQGITVTPRQAQALGITLTPEQAQAQGITLTLQQAQALGITLTPQQDQAQGITLTPQQAQALGITLTPEQAQAQRITVTPSQAQALGITLTPEQAQTQGITATPQQAQGRDITLTHEQFKALMVTLTPEKSQELRVTHTHEQVQALRAPVILQQEGALRDHITPTQGQTLKAPATSEQSQAMQIPVTTQQAQILGVPITQGQDEALGVTITPQQTEAQTQALMFTLTPEKVQISGITRTSEQALAVGIPLTPEQEQVLGIPLTLDQEQVLGIPLTPDQAQALETPLTAEQAWKLGVSTTPEMAQEVSHTLSLKQSRALGITPTYEEAQSLGTPLLLAQAQALGIPIPLTLRPEQSLGVPLTSDKAHVLGSPLTHEQVQSLGAPFTPGQAQPMGTTLMSKQSLESRAPPISQQFSQFWAGPSSGQTLEVGIFSIPDKSIKPSALYMPKLSTTLTPSTPKPFQESKTTLLSGKYTRTRQSVVSSALIDEKSPVFEVSSTPLQISGFSFNRAPFVSGKSLGFPSPKQTLVSKGQFTTVQLLPSEVPPTPGMLPVSRTPPTKKFQISEVSDTSEEIQELQDSFTMEQLGTFQSYLTNYRTQVSQTPYIDEGTFPALMTSLPPLTTQLPKRSQISPSKWDWKSRFPPISKPCVLTSVSDTKKLKMMIPSSSFQELKEQRYFVDVKAQRKNLIILNQTTETSGLPSELYATARNLIIETLHTDTVRLGYLFRKYIAYRLIQRARNNIIKRLQAIQNSRKGYETQNLYIMLNRIDGYQEKIMRVWTGKQKSLEQNRNKCLRKMMLLFIQLQDDYQLNLSQPVPLLIYKKQKLTPTKFIQQPFLELPMKEGRKSVIFKKLRKQDQMEAIWNADQSTSSYPITEKTSPIHSLWAQLGGYPPIPMLLQLDVQSTFRKSLASIQSQFNKNRRRL